MVQYRLKILTGESMHSRKFITLALALGMWLSWTTLSSAQPITIYNSGGFEGFALDTLSPQDNWQTTDISQLIADAAGVVQSATTFSGNRAVRIIGPNMFDDQSFSFSTFWYQDRTGSPFNPVANGTPVVRTTWRQMLTGTPGGLTNMAFAGVFYEGFNAAGTQQVITTVVIDNAERLTAFFGAGGNFVSAAPIPGLMNNWQSMQVDLNFSTQRFTVFLNGLAMAPLINLPFRTTGAQGPSNRLVEFGFQASTFGSGTPPPAGSDNYYDDYLVIATAIPEPTTYALIGLGIVSLAGMWGYRNRQRRQAAEDEVEPLESE